MSLRRNPIILFTVAAVLALMVWAGADGDDWHHAYAFTGQQHDYYNLLVDGFLDGQLHLKVAPDATGKLPYLMDASLYGGRYYLYFGVVPAALLMLPWSFLTGHDLPGNVVTLFLVAAGFLLTLRLYLDARHRYFPTLSAGWDVAGVLLLAFGSGTPILIFDAGVYEVAIASGYLCVSAMLLCLYRAIHSEQHPCLWLVLASLAGGLAVGSRPTYLVSLPILLVPFWLHFREARRGPGLRARRTALLQRLGAPIIPAALIGLMLMAYNHGRFGDPFEFGFKYADCELIKSGMPFARPSFIGSNFQWYYLTPPVLSPYFPYFLPIDASDRPLEYYGYELIHGQWLMLPLLFVATAGLFRARLRRAEFPTALVAITGSALLAFGTIFAVMLTFGFRANRYVVDFQPCLVLALTLAGAWAAFQRAPASRWLEQSYQLAFCSLALLLALFNFLAGLQWMDHVANTRPATYRPLAYYGNYPSYWLQQLGFLEYGPLRFPVTFPLQGKPDYEPLIVTGTSGYIDVVYTARYPNNQAQFFISHDGYGSISSDPVRIKPGIEQIIEVTMGSLYPPKIHPYFRGWKDTEIAQVKTTSRLLLDGTEILHGLQVTFDAPPSSIRLGHNPLGGDARFSGHIGTLRRLETLPPRPEREQEFGLWRIDVVLPVNVFGIGQPLLASGVTGQGNLLLIEALAQNEVRFGLDQWGAGLTHSRLLTIDTSHPHRIEVFVGPQVTRQKLPQDWGIAAAQLSRAASLLQVWLDGQLVWSIPVQTNQQTYGHVDVGTNSQGFSTATSVYSGSLKNLPLSASERRELLHRSLQAVSP